MLGIWAGNGGEGAQYWLHVFTELKNRGLKRCADAGLRRAQGPSRAVETGWHSTIVQTCVVHLLRNSFRYAPARTGQGRQRHSKPLYTAPSEDAAKERFLELQKAWGWKQPAIVKLWSDAWADFVPFLSFDAEIRKVICSTNAIESGNAHIRQAVRARGHFPSETAAIKCVYMAHAPGPDRQGPQAVDHALEGP
ncbi:transposase [Streptomyces sp. NPDC054855]